MLRPFIAWMAVLTGLYLTPFMHSLMLPIDLNTQQLVYEFSALAQFVVLLIHARTWFKPWDWVWVFGGTLFFGIILENGGIILGVFSEPGYLLYIPGLPAPLATALGWVNVLYCAFFAVEKLLPRMPVMAKGLVCSLIGLSLDIPFDPVATRLGWWIWNPLLAVKVWDVPAVNFIAWFWALFPYGAAYYWVRQSKDYGEGRKVLFLVGSFPVILVVELLGVIASLTLTGDRESLLIFQKLISQLGLL